MFANSPQVKSSQRVQHPRLDEIVIRHLRVPFRREPGDLGRAAFKRVEERLAQAPFILDAGCGTGAGTFALAREFPRHLIVGVDKSAARLGVGQRLIATGGMPSNALLLHCELVDFWQLAAAAGLRCEKQFVLYPNPWPKPEQLKRRWHAHPVLPAMLALGGEIELRTNWRAYAEEFVKSMRLAGRDAHVEVLIATQPLTAFERKYAASGHALWRCHSRKPRRHSRESGNPFFAFESIK
jgi:tRNA G46 methylase TrmB